MKSRAYLIRHAWLLTTSRIPAAIARIDREVAALEELEIRQRLSTRFMIVHAGYSRGLYTCFPSTVKPDIRNPLIEETVPRSL